MRPFLLLSSVPSAFSALRSYVLPKFFTRERFGTPQFAALILLFCFLAQCLWLIHLLIRATPDEPLSNVMIIGEGLREWHGHGIAGTPIGRGYTSVREWQETQLGFHSDYDRNHSPLYYLIAAAPALVSAGAIDPQAGLSDASSGPWRWLIRAPYVVFGLLLGASLWYVARRLYGNAGGFIALALFCFSPLIVASASMVLVEPEIGAAWGTFGAIFTAIAVAHTLYAPREVVLWNWRRILLLGVSLALAIGSQFSTILILPLAFLFMLYLAPGRRLAAVAILLASTVVAALILLASYRFSFREFAVSFARAQLLPFVGSALAMKVTYRLLGTTLLRSGPAVLFLLFVSVVTYIVWSRTRYFGTTAPLIVWLILLIMAAAGPHAPGLGFGLLAVPFMFVFIAGLFADLLETPSRDLVRACVVGIIAAHALWSVIALSRLSF